MSNTQLPLTLSFLGGSISSTTAEFCTFPMDMLKTRMQMSGTQGLPQYSSIGHVLSHTYSLGGVKSFYKGISAAATRQFTYSGIRIAIYDKVKYLMGDDLSGGSYWARFIIGGGSGGLSSFITTPLDVAKIRLVNDISRTKYSGFLDCLRKTWQTDGFISGFYKGSSPNVYRSLVVNAAELGTYDNSKAFLMQKFGFAEDSLSTRFWASIMAGFVAAGVSSPIDVVKTRYMNASKPDPTQPKGSQVRYTSPLDCFKKIIVEEGVTKLYSGFLFLWLRLGPWCTVMFITWDLYKDFVGKEYQKYQAKKLIRD